MLTRFSPTPTTITSSTSSLTLTRIQHRIHTHTQTPLLKLNRYCRPTSQTSFTWDTGLVTKTHRLRAKPVLQLAHPPSNCRKQYASFSSSSFPSSTSTSTSSTSMSHHPPPDPVLVGMKRSLPADEGTSADSPITAPSASAVESSERTKRARVDGSYGESESKGMIVDVDVAVGPAPPPAEQQSESRKEEGEEEQGGGEESDSGSDVIISNNINDPTTTTPGNANANEKGKANAKGKTRGKGRRRRADDWDKKKDKEGKDNNKRNRGRAPPPSGLTRNEEDALKKDMGEGEGETEERAKSVRYPKRQCALLIGFCGSGYSGMQIQPDHTRTIEGVLFNSLVRAGAVSQHNADNPTKVNLARAARTDAGVHAAGNVVSLKMITKPPGVEDLVERINQELPPEIRVWGYARTQNSFNARLVCESRKYTYFFPTYLLIPPKPGSGMHRVWSELVSTFPSSTVPPIPSESTTTTAAAAAPSISYEFWDSQPQTEVSTKDEDLARKRAWRISPSQISTLRETASKYLGTHNFHNFTVGREFKDRSNNRFMRRIEVSDPVVYGETEWISVLFHGQSFMLHQRKMMAALVLSCRMGTPPKVIDELYTQREVFIPKMPSLGLLLEEPLFDSYNTRMGAINAKLTPGDPEYRPLIDFDVHRDKIDAFKDEFIYQNMRKVEDRDGLFDAWVRYIDAYAGNDMLYLNPAGVVPDAAVVKRGERRPNPFKEKRVFDTTSFPEKGIKERLEGAVDGGGDVDMEGTEDEEEEVEGLDKRHLAETEG